MGGLVCARWRFRSAIHGSEISQPSSGELSANLDVRARFDNIGGLKVNAAVKSAGVVVGRVKAVALDPERFQADVTLAMDSAYAFPKDSSLKILTSGLLGEQYIGIQAGYEESALKSGDVIGETQSAVVLENLISQFLFNQAAKPDPANRDK